MDWYFWKKEYNLHSQYFQLQTHQRSVNIFKTFSKLYTLIIKIAPASVSLYYKIHHFKTSNVKKIYLQIQRTEALYHFYISWQTVIYVKRQILYLEFAG